MNSLRVNQSRLWSRIEAMAVHGATPAGGCNRQALTDEDRAGRDLFISWCEAADLSVRVDEIGNIFARREGTKAQPPVMTGSHLDTQPSGGRFDGILGVLAGLEVAETLNDHGLETEHPLEIVVWTNEEGCRFDQAMMGSAVWSGAMSLEAAYQLTDTAGLSVRHELERLGYLGNIAAAYSPVHAAFELHIEQGPILEAEKLEVGVVSGVQHMSRHRITIEGQEAHAGPTPMRHRKDPMMALSVFLPQLYELATSLGSDSRITFGCIEALPGSSNTVPGQLTLTMDIRHPDAYRYEELRSQSYEVIAAACSKYGLQHRNEEFWSAAGVVFDEDCVAAVSRAVALLGYSSQKMVSGAGHDACNTAGVCPTGMIFIPCDGGLSHNESENISPEQAARGNNVLLHAMLDRARLVS